MKRVITFAFLTLAMAALTPPVMSAVFAHLPDWKAALGGYVWTTAGVVMFACTFESWNAYSREKAETRYTNSFRPTRDGGQKW